MSHGKPRFDPGYLSQNNTDGVYLAPTPLRTNTRVEKLSRATRRDVMVDQVIPGSGLTSQFREAGATAVFNIYAEPGTGFAGHVEASHFSW